MLQFCKHNRIYSSGRIKNASSSFKENSLVPKNFSSFVGVIFFWMSSENREANFIKLDRPSSQKPEKNPSFFGGGANPKMSWRGRTTLVTNFKTFYRCRFSKALKLEVIFVTKDLIRFSTLEKVRIWRDPIMYSRGRCQHFKLVSRKFALDQHLQNQLKIKVPTKRHLP